MVLTFEYVDEILKSDIQMKATYTEQCFLMVLFVMLYKVLLMFEFVDEILNLNIQMKATEQYFPMELFLIVSFLVLTFESKV